MRSINNLNRKKLHPGFEPCIVKCYSGYTYAQRPDSFIWQDKEHKVQKVETAWLEPGSRHFRVRSEQNKVFELCYQEKQNCWWLKEG